MNPWTFLEHVAWYMTGYKKHGLPPHPKFKFDTYPPTWEKSFSVCPGSLECYFLGSRMCEQVDRIYKHWPQALRDFNLTLAVIGKAADAQGQEIWDAGRDWGAMIQRCQSRQWRETQCR